MPLVLCVYLWYILIYTHESTQTSHWQAWPFVYYSIVSTETAGSFSRVSHGTDARKGRPVVHWMMKHSYSISLCYSLVCVPDTRVSVRILLSALLLAGKTERIGKRAIYVLSVLFSLHFFSDQLWMYNAVHPNENIKFTHERHDERTVNTKLLDFAHSKIRK